MKTVHHFEGKVALVSGGGSGIGRACAVMLAQAGASVVVSDIVERGGNETLDAIRALGKEAVFIKTDVTQPAQVEALVGQVLARYGRLDCAVNSAGIFGKISPLNEQDLADFERVMDINLKGVF